MTEACFAACWNGWSAKTHHAWLIVAAAANPAVGLLYEHSARRLRTALHMSVGLSALFGVVQLFRLPAAWPEKLCQHRFSMKQVSHWAWWACVVWAVLLPVLRCRRIYWRHAVACTQWCPAQMQKCRTCCMLSWCSATGCLFS